MGLLWQIADHLYQNLKQKSNVVEYLTCCCVNSFVACQNDQKTYILHIGVLGGLCNLNIAVKVIYCKDRIMQNSNIQS